MSRLDYDRVATILVDALYKGDDHAANAWGITKRTIRNYRQRLREDEALSAIFLEKKLLAEQAWADDLPAAIREGIDYLRKAPRHLDYTPDNVHAVTGAVKILAELDIVRTVLNARYAELRQPLGEEDRPMGAVGPGDDRDN